MSKTDKPASKTTTRRHNKARVAMGIQGRNILSDEDLKKVLGDDFLEEELKDINNS